MGKQISIFVNFCRTNLFEHSILISTCLLISLYLRFLVECLFHEDRANPMFFGTKFLGRSFQPTKTISPFFPFFVLSYVGYVPASDDLGICCFVWQCEFLSKFLFVTEEKSTFCRKVFGGPRSPKT